MFHDFGASPLNFTMAKATGFQSVFSPACNTALKESPNNSIPTAEIRRWNLIFLSRCSFSIWRRNLLQSVQDSSLSLGISSVRNGAAKVDREMKALREGLKQFSDIRVTVFLLALRGFTRYPPSTCRTKPPQRDEIVGEAQRESKNESSFVQKTRFARGASGLRRARRIRR